MGTGVSGRARGRAPRGIILVVMVGGLASGMVAEMIVDVGCTKNLATSGALDNDFYAVDIFVVTLETMFAAIVLVANGTDEAVLVDLQ